MSASATQLLFPAPIQRREYGDIPLNEGLYRLIKTMQTDGGVKNRCELDDITTVGGYQPDVVLHQELAADQVWQQFIEKIVHPGVQEYMEAHEQVAGYPQTGSRYHFERSWVVLYPPGAYQAAHFHRDTFCVFTYYAKVPSRPSPEGGLTFLNPHLESTYPLKRGARYDHTVYPRSGSCIVFPGWLQHYSHPHRGEEERLIVTIDIKFTPPE